MSYLVLARKYRPQSFEDLVGQSHVAKTLANAIAQNRVAHAFLFTGVRGVGKTTSARLLAKCLNCLGADGKATGPTATDHPHVPAIVATGPEAKAFLAAGREATKAGAATLKGNPQITEIEVQGHADERGDDDYNLALSQRRAAAVKAARIRSISASLAARGASGSPGISLALRGWTPVTLQRFRRFRSIGRGWWSFRILLALIVMPLYLPLLIFGSGAVDAVRLGESPKGALLLLAAQTVLLLTLAPPAAAAALRIGSDNPP